MDQLQLFDLFKKYVPATPDSLTEHAESLCVLTANIICDNKPLYKVREWLAQYSDGLFDKPVEANLFNDDQGQDLSCAHRQIGSKSHLQCFFRSSDEKSYLRKPKGY